MSKVIVKAKNQVQLQEWVDKLKDAGKPYEFKKDLTLLVTADDAIQLLGVKGNTPTRWYQYLIGIAILYFLISTFFNWCSRSLDNMPELTKIEKINRQFMSGSNENLRLARYIKKNMFNPKSYDHVETSWRLTKDTLAEVYTTIRGENQLGGMTIQKAHALMDAEGNVIQFEWVEQK